MRTLKRSISILLSVLMIAGVLSIVPFTVDAVPADYSKFLFGDINFDGSINLIDLSMITNYLNGTIELTEEQQILADVNGDGVVDDEDYEEIEFFLEYNTEMEIYSSLRDYGFCGNNVKYMLKNDGALTIFGTGEMCNYTSWVYPNTAPWYEYKVTSAVITSGVTSIGDWAFELCGFLESITIPDSVTSIGSYAFEYCESLTSITIPDSVTSICRGTFNECWSLDSITIPGSVTSIDDFAFGELESITIKGYSGTEAERYANDNGFTFVDLDFDDDDDWYDDDDDDDDYYGDFSYTLFYDGTAEITGYYGYELSVSIPSVIDGHTVTSIADNAFEEISDLESVIIPNSVTSVGNCAFRMCSNLKNVTIGRGVTSLSQRMFSGCTNLRSITIPDSVNTIGSYAFEDCTSLESVVIPNSVISINTGAFDTCTSLESVTIPSSVTSIGAKAFGYIYNYTSREYHKNYDFVIVGYSGTAAETYADDNGFEFFDIDSIDDDDDDDDWYDDDDDDDDDYYGDFSYTLFYDGTAEITGYNGYSLYVSIPSTINGHTVTSIGEDAFKYSDIVSVTIPNSVKSIGDNAFYYCDGLVNITIPNSVTSVGRWAFQKCYDLENVTIGSGMTRISYRMFAGCTSLEKITIPGNIQTIESYAFEDCTSLSSVLLLDGVKYINEYAFDTCTSLNVVIIPRSVTSIGTKAFGYNYDYDDEIYSKNYGFVIGGYKGTEAETYADNNGFDFIDRGEYEAKALSGIFTDADRKIRVSSVYTNTSVCFCLWTDNDSYGMDYATLTVDGNTYSYDEYDMKYSAMWKTLSFSRPGTYKAVWTGKMLNGDSFRLENTLTVKSYTTPKPSVTKPATVTKKTPKITVSKTSYTKTCDNKAFSLNAKTNGNGRLTYTSSDKKVVTVSSSGKVTIKGSGKATITIKSAETSKYKSTTRKITIKVKPGQVRITSGKTSPKKFSLNFKKQKNCSGYETRLSETKSFNRYTKKTYSSGKKSLTVNVAKTKKFYYLKIRAYKYIDGKKVYGKWTTVPFST